MATIASPTTEAAGHGAHVASLERGFIRLLGHDVDAREGRRSVAMGFIQERHTTGVAVR